MKPDKNKNKECLHTFEQVSEIIRNYNLVHINDKNRKIYD